MHHTRGDVDNTGNRDKEQKEVVKELTISYCIVIMMMEMQQRQSTVDQSREDKRKQVLQKEREPTKQRETGGTEE